MNVKQTGTAVPFVRTTTSTNGNTCPIHHAQSHFNPVVPLMEWESMRLWQQSYNLTPVGAAVAVLRGMQMSF